MRRNVDRLQQLRGLVTVNVTGDTGVPLSAAAPAGRSKKLWSTEEPSGNMEEGCQHPKGMFRYHMNLHHGHGSAVNDHLWVVAGEFRLSRPDLQKKIKLVVSTE